MADKKNQHLVPRVYLKGFSNIEKRNGNDIFNIFVTSKKEISKSQKKGLNHSCFTKSNFYNLDNKPTIENELSKIENLYLRIMKNVENKNLSTNDILFISNFTLLQLQRVEAWINNFQDGFNKIVEMVQNKKFSENIKEISIKMLKEYILDNMYKPNIIFEQGISFVENKSDMLFITSDNPVVHRMLHIDEIKSIFDDENIKYNNSFTESMPAVVFFFPLNERLSLISTKLLESNNLEVYSINNLETIMKLNLFSYENAYKNIYSSFENPLKEYELIIHTMKNQYKDFGFWIYIYTQNNRYQFKLKKYIGKVDSIELYLTSSSDVNTIKNDNNLKELTIFKDEKEELHMKKIRIGEIDDTLNKIIIESQLKLEISF